MANSRKTGSKGSPEETIKAVVAKTPGATTDGIARVVGISRSTAGMVLARLADTREITRHRGARDRGKRLPDRWTSSGVEIPDAYTGHVLPAIEKPDTPAGKSKGGKKPTAKASDGAATGSKPEGGKLKPGGLDPLVLRYLKDNAASGPHGPTAIAKALERSSGAVGNCLVRLTDAKKVKLASDKPRRYSLPA